jgi:hypothetical protein
MTPKDNQSLLKSNLLFLLQLCKLRRSLGLPLLWLLCPCDDDDGSLQTMMTSCFRIGSQWFMHRLVVTTNGVYSVYEIFEVRSTSRRVLIQIFYVWMIGGAHSHASHINCQKKEKMIWESYGFDRCSVLVITGVFNSFGPSPKFCPGQVKIRILIGWDACWCSLI